MSRKSLLMFVSLTLSLFAVPVGAQPFSALDPVTMGMGGVGVALPDPTTSTLFNPAELSAVPRETRHGFAGAVAAGAEAYDPDSAISTVNDVRNEFDTLNRLVSGLTTSSARSTYTAIADTLGRINSNLISLDNKSVNAQAGASVLMTRPGRRLGVGVTTSLTATVSGVTRYTDSRYVSALLSAADKLAAGTFNQSDYNTLKSYSDAQLSSEVQATGVAIGQVGISLSHRFSLAGHALDIGVTPKAMRVMTINYSASPATASTSDVTNARYRKNYSDVNLDLGALTHWGQRAYAGLVVRNVIPHTYDTAPNPLGQIEQVRIRPAVRAGVGYDAGWYRLGLDADLTRNQPVAFEKATRFVSVGGAVNVFDWLQLRAGYRLDTVDSSRDVVTGGVGLSPFSTLHFDVAAEGSRNDLGAAARLALTF